MHLQVPARMTQLDPADLLTDSAEDADKPAIAIQVGAHALVRHNRACERTMIGTGICSGTS